MTLTSLITEYLTERRNRAELTRRTARNLRYCLDSLDVSFGNRPLHHLTPRVIDRWLETVGHLAPSTRRNHLSAARTFCAWLVRCGKLKANPCEDVPPIRQPRSVPRAMSTADLAALYRVLPDQRAKVIVELMLGLGLRCVEVSRLAVEDYDPVSATIEVTGKGSHQRVLPVPTLTGHVIGTYLDQVGVVAGPLIRSPRTGRGLSAPTISTYVSRWMDAAGLKSRPWDGRSAHALRHTALSDVLERCHDIHVVREMAGHTNIATTSIYLRRANIGQLRDAMEGRRYAA